MQSENIIVEPPPEAPPPSAITPAVRGPVDLGIKTVVKDVVALNFADSLASPRVNVSTGKDYASKTSSLSGNKLGIKALFDPSVGYLTVLKESCWFSFSLTKLR